VPGEFDKGELGPLRSAAEKIKSCLAEEMLIFFFLSAPEDISRMKQLFSS